MDQRLLETTKQTWQAYSQETLSDHDAREIITNVSGFFGVLRRWKTASSIQGQIDATD